MTIYTRRKFLALSGLGAAGVATSLGTRLAFATPNEAELGDAVVAIFLRGGADGLTLAPPYDYPSYRQMRPSIAVPPPGSNGGALPLNSGSASGVVFPSGIDGVVGLHPAFQPIYDTLWTQGRLAVVPAAGLPRSESATRSHFSAQVFVNRGSASSTVRGGWLGRILNNSTDSTKPGLAGISGSNQTNSMTGARNSANVPNVNDFGLWSFDRTDESMAAIAALNAGQDSVSGQGRNVLQTLDAIADVDADANVEAYPNSGLGRQLNQVANLLKADLGLRAAAIDMDGWDTHTDQGGPGDTGSRIWRLTDNLASSLRAFADDTDGLNEITVVVVSEFGRTVNENGSRGTDHGRAGTVFAMGAGVQGGVFGDDYPDAVADDPDDGDTTVATDYRKVVAEIAGKRVGVADLDLVFPTYTHTGDLGLARA
ncbi:MAG: DUF1501 domain-containing protein [Acidimicrobiales bacterium]